MRLAFEREWLQLGHYQHGLFGGYESSVRGKDFFLSPNGSRAPEQELAATLERFFSGREEDRTRIQCSYLARRDFLSRALRIPSHELLDCPKSREWFAKLNSKRASLIYATGSFHESASSFGHLFLRLENPERGAGQDLLNYGVNYAARTGDSRGALYALYGLFGFFPGGYGLAPYHHLIKEYTNLEGRDLWEYELSLEPHEIERMMKHLIELELGYFDYYFLDDNCAHMIEVALKVARPSLKTARRTRPWVLPLDVLKSIVESGIVARVNLRASLRTEFERSYATLESSERSSIANIKKNFSTDAASDAWRAAAPRLSVAALETAQDFFALMEAGDSNWRRVTHALSVERSKRDETRLPPDTPSKPAPDTAHGSASATLSAYDEVDRGWGSAVSLRAVGRDLLDSSIGGGRSSELVLGEFEGRSRNRWDFRLSHVTLIRMLSTYPITRLETPLSWGFALDWQNAWRLTGKAGASFDLDRARWINLLSLRAQESIDGRQHFVPGCESLIALEAAPRFRLIVGATTSVQESTLATHLLAGAAWSASRDFELRLERTEFGPGASLRAFF